MSDPRWLAEARRYVGQREIRGRAHNPLILSWWQKIRSGFTDDETPWCAGFTGAMLENVGIKSTRSASALSYASWGVALPGPAIGAIVVFSRRGGGHVGFCVGETRTHVIVLGGNQSDAVTIAKFPKAGGSLRVVGYRWPAGEPLPGTGAAVSDNDGVADGGRVTFGDLPDGGAADDGSFSGKIKHWSNAILTGGAFTAFAAFNNWQVAGVVVAAGVIVFCIIWFTHARQALNRKPRR